MADAIFDARDSALTGLLDDASMFPPARLEPAAALEAHLIRRGDDRSWLVKRLVAPIHLVDALHTHIAQLDLDEDLAGRPLELGVVLGRAGTGTVVSSVQRDLSTLEPLLADDRVRITSLELSVAGKRPEEEVPELLDAVGGSAALPEASVAVEVAVSDRPAGEVVRMLAALGAASSDRQVLAKARMGGGGVPALGDVELGGFLLACAANRIAALIGPGLTGPVRSPGHDGDQGILNVLAAAVVAYRGGRLQKIEQILATPGEQVRLGSGALIVGEEVVESELLASCRSDFLLGIGSVEPDQPISALVDLGVLQSGGARS